MRQDILLAALSALTVASAQTSSSSTNYTVNIAGLDPGTKAGWCNAEYNSCVLLCSNNPTANACDVTSLNYTCTCSNGSAPGLQYYIQTIPTFLCNEAYSECIAANTGSQQAQDACKKNIKDNCGTLDPTKVSSSSSGSGGSSSSGSSGSSSGSSASSSAGASSTTNAPAASNSASQSAANNAPSSSSSHAAAATNVAYLGHGVAVAAAGLFAAML